MFGYYLQLALRSFRRNTVLTVLMVLTIALGIGASMTTLTVFHVLSGNPIPQKSSKLFYPRIDPRAMGRNYTPGEPEDQMTRYDAEALLRERRGDRQAVMSSGMVVIGGDSLGRRPSRSGARYTSADFFAMFEVPFLSGQSWNAEDDDNRARVAVIGRKLSDKLFGTTDAVGREIEINNSTFRVVGVIDEWRPVPRFYDLSSQRFGATEQVLLPFSTSRALNLEPSGNVNCWGDSNADAEGSYGLNAPCSWLQYWVELDSPEKVASYRQYLGNYADQQHASGRFQRPGNVRLDDVMGWLDYKRVVPSDVRLQMWLAFGFLGVCLLNTVGLLLAKFLRRSGDIGVRRALGAPRSSIFAQCLVEAGSIGLSGGVIGLGVAYFGLWLVRLQPDSYAKLAHLNLTMLLTTFVLAVIASLLAGVLPAWRACQVAPAIQLKSQ